MIDTGATPSSRSRNLPTSLQTSASPRTPSNLACLGKACDVPAAGESGHPSLPCLSHARPGCGWHNDRPAKGLRVGPLHNSLPRSARSAFVRCEQSQRLRPSAPAPDVSRDLSEDEMTPVAAAGAMAGRKAAAVGRPVSASLASGAVPAFCLLFSPFWTSLIRPLSGKASCESVLRHPACQRTTHRDCRSGRARPFFLLLLLKAAPGVYFSGSCSSFAFFFFRLWLSTLPPNSGAETNRPSGGLGAMAWPNGIPSLGWIGSTMKVYRLTRVWVWRIGCTVRSTVRRSTRIRTRHKALEIVFGRISPLWGGCAPARLAELLAHVSWEKKGSRPPMCSNGVRLQERPRWNIVRWASAITTQ